MVAALMFGPTHLLVASVQQVCSGIQDLCLYKVLNTYPAPYELTRLLHTFTPDVVFLEIGTTETALSIAGQIKSLRPATAIIGFGRPCGREKLYEAKEAGISEVLSYPFTAEEFQSAVVGVLDGRGAAGPENVIAFVPAKAGSGASTTAVNVAGCLAREWNQRVLVIDADLYSGVVSVLVNSTSEYSFLDALENMSRLNDEVWGQLKARAHGFDLLASARAARPDPISQLTYHRFLNFVRPRYDTVIVDLPDITTSVTEAFGTRAKTVYVVCTPEAPSLVLARRRIYELKNIGVSSSRIDVVINGHTDDDPEVNELERALERRIVGMLPYSHSCVRRATAAAGLVEENSELGRALVKLAETLAGIEPPAPARPAAQTGLGFIFRRRAIQQS